MYRTMTKWLARCPKCGLSRELVQATPTCPNCGTPLLLLPDLQELRDMVTPDVLANRVAGVWRYRELLPVSRDPITLGEGGTRLNACRRLGREVDLRGLLVKDETKNPTGCFIDRGSTVLVSRIVEEGYQGVYGTVKGNLGASLAAYSARAGVGCAVRVDGPTDPAKLYQMIAYGAAVSPPDGRMEAPERYYNVLNSDPLLVEGEKTISLEILESLGWEEPDAIVVPVGSGSLMTAIWKGIIEARELGLVRSEGVRLYGVRPREDSAVALDLHFPEPDRLDQAREAVRESGGDLITVGDEEMLEASRKLARAEGIFAEPAAASTLAAAERLRVEGEISPSDTVVLIVTGSGLKDPTAAVRELERLHLTDAYMRGERVGRPIGRTKTAILRILTSGKMHGYEIWRRLRGSGVEISLPAVYQHLKSLEEMGAIARVQTVSKNGRSRVVYSITPRGRLLLSTVE